MIIMIMKKGKLIFLGIEFFVAHVVLLYITILLYLQMNWWAILVSTGILASFYLGIVTQAIHVSTTKSKEEEEK